ncbi:MAG TPA: cytochrome c-type biogenesis protein [Gemmatimonadaceae bacterium]|jgi:cytochrome c-type biogenesis protein CcmH/NrfF
MIYSRILARLLVGVTAAVSLAGGTLVAQAPALPAAPQNAPQDSGALRVQVQGTLTDAQKNDKSLEAATKSVASELRCPVCQGVSIQDSPSELAQQMRTVVKEQLAAGKSSDQVKDYFISKYGEWILLEPKASGFNLLVYLLPAFLVLGGAVFLVFLVKKWTSAAPAAAAPSALDDE